MESGSFLDVINADIQDMTNSYNESGIFPAASSSILFSNLQLFDATYTGSTEIPPGPEPAPEPSPLPPPNPPDPNPEP